MNIIEPSFEIIDEIDSKNILAKIERAGRVCYKSEDKITEESSIKFVRRMIASGHESTIEHENISVRIICDRGVTHEIVRHRIASYSQESTRYCNYSKDKFGSGITVIRPHFWAVDDARYSLWKFAMEYAESAYLELLRQGATAQEARCVLPNSLKTEIVVTMNLREWRHFFMLRCAEGAHPQMREITVPLLLKFRELIPVIFDDIRYVDNNFITLSN